MTVSSMHNIAYFSHYFCNQQYAMSIDIEKILHFDRTKSNLFISVYINIHTRYHTF